MKRNFGRYALLVLLSALFCGGCSRSATTEDYTEPVTVADTVTEETAEPDTVAEEKPVVINTPAEAIEYMRRSEDSAKYMSGILPVMAEDELSYCVKLLHSTHPHFFIVDKAQLEIVVYDRFGREEKRVGMACSKNFGTKHKYRDNRTPEGFFSAKGVYDSTEWLFTDDDGNTSQVKGQFGPRFIRLNVPNTSQIGIHGTCAPWSIGHRRSHGCIRVTNEHIMELVQYVDSGMPVIVSPGSRDMAVNAEEGYYVPAVSTRRSGSKASAKGYINREPQEAKTDDSAVSTATIEAPDTVTTVAPDTIHATETEL